MATKLSYLLDICSEFTRGQDFIADITSDKHKVKKSRKARLSDKISQEEKEYAKYIGFNRSENGVSLEAADDRNYQHSMDRQRSLEHCFNDYNENRGRLPNRIGAGRGRIFRANNSYSPPAGASGIEPVRPTRRELNDRVISEQLREMGIGISNNDIETEFHKKFQTKGECPSSVPDTNSSGSQSQQEETRCKQKREPRKFYLPPHLRSKCQETVTISDYDFDNKNVEIDEESKGSSPVLMPLSRPVYRVSTDEDFDDIKNFINSDVSEIGNDVLPQNGDIVDFTKKHDCASSSLIQFKIVSNERSKTKSVKRNALISGLLNRSSNSVKVGDENTDLNSAGDNRECEGAAGIDLRNDSEVLDCDEDNHCLAASTCRNNFRDTDSLRSKSSSPSSIFYDSSYDSQQPIYFTAPVSGKILQVNTTKSYMDIIPKSQKPVKLTLGDFVFENRLSKSSCSTPSNLDSGLNPLAEEFSPKSFASQGSSDSENFYLDIKEFPPL